MANLPCAYAIIMAGGKGERFWPLSTSRRPKQLLALAGGKPLILQSVDRLEGIVPPERILIVTNESLVAPIRDMLGQESRVGVLGEPVGRDTAAAIAAGADILVIGRAITGEHDPARAARAIAASLHAG